MEEKDVSVYINDCSFVKSIEGNINKLLSFFNSFDIATSKTHFNILNVMELENEISPCLPLTIEWLMYKKHGWTTFFTDAYNGKAELNQWAEYQITTDNSSYEDQIEGILYGNRGKITNCKQLEDADWKNIYTEIIYGRTERFNILILDNSEAAHAIGIWRQYTLSGKLNSFYVFDPNFGEFYFDVTNTPAGATRFKNVMDELIGIYSNYKPSAIYTIDMENAKKIKLTAEELEVHGNDTHKTVVKESLFDNFDDGSNTLFVYFCGTCEDTLKHKTHFMKDVKAKYQIYIKGLDARKTVYENGIDCIEVSKAGNGSTDIFHLKHSKRVITCIEQEYSGGMVRGYKGADSANSANNAYAEVQKVLDVNKDIKNVIFSGHSRGAAVGLSSFAWKVANENTLKLGERNVSFFFLDPVAGQTGNTYWMGDKWNTQQLYHKLFEKFEAKVQINEVWALAGKMALTANFNPARRFLCQPIFNNIKLRRFGLGFTHSSLVGTDTTPYKKLQLDTPYDKLVSMLNQYCDLGLNWKDSYVFEEVSKFHKMEFDGLNDNEHLKNSVYASSLDRREKLYNTLDGVTMKFSEFLDGYPGKPKPSTERVSF